MNFLKISGLVFGTISVAGVGGTVIYYADRRNNRNILDNKSTLDNIQDSEVIDLNVKVDSSENVSSNFEVTPFVVGSESKNVEINKKNGKNTHQENLMPKINRKSQFTGKIVFYKKTGTGDSATYEAKLMSASQYDKQKKKFDTGKDDTKKYDKVNKVIHISGNLDFVEARKKLKEIFATSSLLSVIKVILKSKETDLKDVFGDKIYSDLKSKFSI